MEIPTKYFYDFDGNKLVNSSGNQVAHLDTTPQASLGSKPLINIQLVDGDNAAYEGLEATATVQMLVDSDYVNGPVSMPMGSTEWTNTTGSEYSKSLGITPTHVYFDESLAVEGTAGSLSAGEWDYNSTTEELHVRLTDSTDPDTKADDWITVKMAVTDSTKPFIECYSDETNQAGTWYDTGTETFRNPLIASGELTFRLNANTVAYYLRIATSEKETATAEIQFFNAASDLIVIKKLDFICCNRIYESSATPLDVNPSNYYTKAEADALHLASNEFTELTDTPSSYTGEGGNFIKVNSGEDALESVDGAARVIPTDESTDTTCFLLFVNAATGAVDVHTGSNITFNSATGALAVTSIAAANTNWDAAYTHVGNNGSDHSYIDQSVISGASPTFVGTNFTGIPASAVSAGFVEVDGTTPLTANWDIGNFTLTANGLTLDGTFTDGTTSISGGGYTGVGKLAATPDAITATSEGVAASLDTLNTEVTTNGDSDLDNVTLANGTSGQVKHIYCVAEGNAADTWKITPATMAGGTRITFSGVGEGATLIYADNEGWVVVGNNGGTIS